MSHRIATLISVAALSGWAVQAGAKVTAEEAAKLGTELTPVGAEKGGNADGTIPAWTPVKKAGDLSGGYSSDPAIDGEKPLFTITAANMAQYADKLTEGNKELMRRYPDSYKMNVYKSYRKVAWPQEIYDATKKNATTCELVDIDTPDNCELGFPFPIVKSGAEPIWNHKLKWRGNEVTRYNNQMIVQMSGDYQLTKITEDVKFSYANMDNPVKLTKGSGEFLKYLSETVAPPRLAGTFILVHEKAGVGSEGRSAWLYSPGLRRIRRAPTVCCDNPYEGTDGHQFYDQVDMFNGVLERYNWKLLGKREMYIGYNGNRLAGPQTTYDEMAAPKHLNQDLPRYELHRVWVVESNIKAGTDHTFHKRVFYVDEDGWNIVAVDAYDKRGELFQFQEGHYVIAQNILAGSTVPEVIYHFNSGRYFITAMANEDKPNKFDVSFEDSYFLSNSVQKRTRR